MLRLNCLLLLLCACATVSPLPQSDVEGPDAGVSPACQAAYDGCLNGCFQYPNYKRYSAQCIASSVGDVCPQKEQLVDTIAAASCFNACDWDAKPCR